VIPSGMGHGDERERTADEVSKGYKVMSKLEDESAPGSVWWLPISWPRGIRYVGGVNVSWALMRNVRTCRRDAKGERQVRGPHEAEGTDARHRDGAARTSGDGL
jgi:hypothetical protein